MKIHPLIITLFFMAVLTSQDNFTTIYLIRHAEKADTTPDTHLSESGKERAIRWMEYLVNNRIDAIYTTPYHRTRETARPLADALKMKVTEYGPREMDLITLAKKHHNQSVVVVGHSNTIPGYINKALGESRYTDIPEEEFGQIYIVQISNDKVVNVQVETL